MQDARKDKEIEKAVARILRKGKTKGTKFHPKDDADELAQRDHWSRLLCVRAFIELSHVTTHTDELSQRPFVSAPICGVLPSKAQNVEANSSGMFCMAHGERRH